MAKAGFSQRFRVGIATVALGAAASLLPATPASATISFPVSTWIAIGSFDLHDLNDDYFTDAIDGEDGEIFGNFRISWGTGPGQEKAFRLGQCMRDGYYADVWYVHNHVFDWGAGVCNPKDVHSNWGRQTDAPFPYDFKNTWMCVDVKHPWLRYPAPGPVSFDDVDCGSGGRYRGAIAQLRATDVVTIQYHIGDQDDFDPDDILCQGSVSMKASDIWANRSGLTKIVRTRPGATGQASCDLSFFATK